MLRLTRTPLACATRLVVLLLSAAACSGDGTTPQGADYDGGRGDDDAAAGDGGEAGPDTTPPTVVSSFPRAGATGAATATEVTATLSESMAAATLSDATFRLAQGTTAVAGAVTYYRDVVTFTPDSELTSGTMYTATLTTAATDLAGNALEQEKTWSFVTDSAPRVGPAPVALGAAGTYAILAKAAVNNEPTSKVTGDIGLSPAAASYITGFALTRAGTKWTAAQVVGNVYAANNDKPTPANLTTAIGSMEAAYTDAASRTTPDALNLGSGAIGGMTLAPGLYRWTSTVTIPTDLVISGAANDVWIFQVTGDLKLSAATRITLSGGAQAKNIVWQVAGLVDLGTTSHAEGVMLSQTAIVLKTGASINGRLLAQTAVNIAGATVTAPVQ